MALNRYLYPAKNSNLPEFVIMSQRWAVGAVGAVTAAGAATDPGRGLTCTRTGVGAYTVAFAPNTDGGTPTVQAIVHPIVSIVDATKTNLVQILTVTQSQITFQVLDDAGVAAEIDNGGNICVSFICTNSAVTA
jgi:hypothetical protein